MEPVAPTIFDRLWTALRDLIRAEFATFTYLGLYEYQVTGATATTVDATPVDSTIPLPNLNAIPIGSLSDGGIGKPTVGNKCLIEFINGDPTRPTILFNDAQVVTVTLDALAVINIGPSAANPVLIGPGASMQAARVGDIVTCFFPVGMWGVGSILTPPSGPPITLAGTPAQILTSVSGIIVGGNNRVLQ